ncbi:MAG: hypothetical protein ABSF63_12640 [Candidatus Bathyarchaeia archaeon]|jgi:hypothetical protein
MVLSDEGKREIERLKNVAIKSHWASDLSAQSIAIDVIAAHGPVAIPTLIEISQRTVGPTQKHALDRIFRLESETAAFHEQLQSYKILCYLKTEALSVLQS